jgi:hydroxyacylglutathione hydrolase
MLTIIQIPVLTDNYSYLLHDEQSGETAVVDPALAEPILTVLKQRGWQLTYVLNTHHHNDHIGGNAELKQQTGCKIIASTIDKHRIPEIDRCVQEGDTIQLGEHTAQVINTAGHTHGHVVYYFADSNALFCGDTLFVMGCGRLFEGSPSELWQSLQKLKALPVDTRVYCAHEYSESNAHFALSIEPDNLAIQEKAIIIQQQRANNLPTVPSTIGEEIDTNPFFRADCPELWKSIKDRTNIAVDVFAQLRRLKDNW